MSTIDTIIVTSAMVATISSSSESASMSSTSGPGETNRAVEGGDGGGDGGFNLVIVVALIAIIVFLTIAIFCLITLFVLYKRRNQKKLNTGKENYYDTVEEAKLKSLTASSSSSGSHLVSDNNAQSNTHIYSVLQRSSSRKEASSLERLQAVERTQSFVSDQLPLSTLLRANDVPNPLYAQIPIPVTDEIEVGVDNEVLDHSFNKGDDPMPVDTDKMGLSPRKDINMLPSKTQTRNPKKLLTSSSTPSDVLSLLKSTSSQTTALQHSMQSNPLYASRESLDLHIYDTIKRPKNSASSESIYNEIYESNTLITTEDPKIDLARAAQDLYPYSSIYVEPLPLNKLEGPPLVTADNIVEVAQLGTGQFGEVVLANTVGLSEYYLQLSPSEDCSVSIWVAVKKLKLDSTKDILRSFEKEIKFMARLKDDNVIRLLGICTTGTPFIMMEYMENGDLNQYLQRFDFLLDPNKAPSATQITRITLTYMAYQIASGMKYLSSLKFIHRDLATRNVLVGKDFVVKIADFGMSQNLYSAYYFKVKGRAILPIRWMAYECFFGKFSIKSDVWAFGVTLWEIFTLAKQQPYNEMADQQVIDSVFKGKKQIIMAKPDYCPDDIYKVMLSCWFHDPSKRANFTDLCNALKEITNRQ